MSKPIFELVDELPKNNMTVKVLNALDFVIPGQWQNLTGFENTIKVVTQETDESLIQQIGERAITLYNDKSQGYQKALWLYQTISGAGRALGTAALGNKIGENVSFLGFLSNLTPKPEKAQTIDLTLKVLTELLAYCQINGIPGDSIGDFVMALGSYGSDALMRMTALVCLDGLVPLGPNFIQSVGQQVGLLTPSDMNSNPAFKQMQDFIPGNNDESKLGFIGETFNSVSGWMTGFVSGHSLTPQNVVKNLQGFVDIADDKLDYVAAFLDMSTNYYEHTGVQTLARSLIERAVAEI
jgi:hypothetical protein